MILWLLVLTNGFFCLHIRLCSSLNVTNNIVLIEVDMIGKDFRKLSEAVVIYI